MSDKKIKIWELSLLLALCVTLCHGVMVQSRQTALEESLIRLHVIGADDSEAEQAVKMQVRDAVLNCLLPMTEKAETAEDARLVIEKAIPELERAASAAADGRDITVLFGETNYPLRSAGGYTLPAGTYSSLRVILDEGQGRNWWGVIFPDLTSFSTGDYTDAAKILGDKNFTLITEGEGVEVRFKILEWLADLKTLFES